MTAVIAKVRVETKVNIATKVSQLVIGSVAVSAGAVATWALASFVGAIVTVGPVSMASGFVSALVGQ